MADNVTMSVTKAAAASTSSLTKSRKRSHGNDPAASPATHASSSHASTSTSSGSPITVTSKRAQSKNKTIKTDKDSTAKKKKTISRLPSPPDSSSDEEDELAQSTDDEESLSELERKQKSSQLTEKERKKIAMKRLKKARKEKGEKEVYYSPVIKSKLNHVKDKGKGKEKAVPVKVECEDSEIDELASQQSLHSNHGSVGRMPWESGSEDEASSADVPHEPVYNDEPAVKQVFQDLPPPLPQPELQWKRKARPPSRRYLFDATQQPTMRRKSPSSPMQKGCDSDDDLPDLIPRSSAKSKSSQSRHPSTPVLRAFSECPQSATFNDMHSPPRSGLMPEAAFQKPRGLSDKKPPVETSAPSQQVDDTFQSPPRNHASQQRKPPPTDFTDGSYWGDISFATADFAIVDQEAERRTLRPFFTPEPEELPTAALVAGPSNIPDLEALIAGSMEQAAEAETKAAKAVVKSSEKQSSADWIVDDRCHASTPKGSQPPPVESEPGRVVIPKVSSSAKRVAGSAVFADSPSARTSQNPLVRDIKGKGRAIENSASQAQKLSATKQVEDIEEEEWSDFDELELTQARPAHQQPKQLAAPMRPVAAVSPAGLSPDRDPPPPYAAIVRDPALSNSRESSSKAPSSEEESQACSYCGNIVICSQATLHA